LQKILQMKGALVVWHNERCVQVLRSPTADVGGSKSMSQAQSGLGPTRCRGAQQLAMGAISVEIVTLPLRLEIWRAVTKSSDACSTNRSTVRPIIGGLLHNKKCKTRFESQMGRTSHRSNLPIHVMEPLNAGSASRQMSGLTKSWQETSYSALV